MTHGGSCCSCTGRDALAGVAERAGFRAEGVVRQRFLHRGQHSDVVLYALLATDPRPAA